MKMKLPFLDEEIDVMVEVFNINRELGSTVREPKPEEYMQFKLRGCKGHNIPGCPQLVYDIPGFMYDERRCAICGITIGHI